MPDKLGFEARLALPFRDALARTRDALKAEGFGILTEIDLQAAFHEKLGREFRSYVILGACNPPLAYEAVSANPAVGLLLPCNVTVEASGAQTSLVRFTNPMTLLSVAEATGAGELRRVAEDAQERLARVARALGAGSTPAA
jgi:uncharacterized protein (DUF302 family)